MLCAGSIRTAGKAHLGASTRLESAAALPARAAVQRRAAQQQQQQPAAVDACQEQQAVATSSRRAAVLGVAAAPALAALAAALQLPVAPAARAEDAPTPPAPGPPGAAPQDERTTLITNAEAANILTPSDKQVLALNRRVQAQNRCPEEFPGFVRQGFDILIVADGYSETEDGLLYRDFKEGTGATPVDGQQVVFDYTGYNESGAAIDSSYRQGRPAETRLGIQGLIPGFEEGIRTMKVGSKRRIIVPPRLGPPVGPSTFFSAKQCEVFDIELRAIKTCRQEQAMMFSRVVCE